ncbi:MAG: hypothetical protein EOP54_29630 [Sphingobacteriales bacterium]|nr:MAG: hypothetical protein EOP54_29630 [Sphingobacteriales bacterium]
MKKLLAFLLLGFCLTGHAQKTVSITNTLPGATVGVLEVQTTANGLAYPFYKSVNAVINVPVSTTTPPAATFVLSNSNTSYFPFFSTGTISYPIHMWNKITGPGATPIPYGSTVLNNATDAGTQFFYSIKLQIVIGGVTYTPTLSIYNYSVSGPGWTASYVVTGNTYTIKVKTP